MNVRNSWAWARARNGANAPLGLGSSMHDCTLVTSGRVRWRPKCGVVLERDLPPAHLGFVPVVGFDRVHKQPNVFGRLIANHLLSGLLLAENLAPGDGHIKWQELARHVVFWIRRRRWTESCAQRIRVGPNWWCNEGHTCRAGAGSTGVDCVARLKCWRALPCRIAAARRKSSNDGQKSHCEDNDATGSHRGRSNTTSG